MALRSDNSLRATLLRILSERVGPDGYGQWMTMREMLETPHQMKAGLVHRVLYDLWQCGIISARINPAGRGKHSSQQYRMVPDAGEVPLYVETPGSTARPLAACFGGYTYPQSNRKESSAWQA